MEENCKQASTQWKCRLPHSRAQKRREANDKKEPIASQSLCTSHGRVFGTCPSPVSTCLIAVLPSASCGTAQSATYWDKAHNATESSSSTNPYSALRKDQPTENGLGFQKHLTVSWLASDSTTGSPTGFRSN